MLTVHLAARLGRGDLPGSLIGQPAKTLLLNFEDDRAATLRPRLEAARGDLGLVVGFVDVEDSESETVLAFTMPDHLDLLAEAVWSEKPALVVVDPISAALGIGVDSHKDASVRHALAPLAKLAEDADVAILIVAHTNKASDSNAIRRLGGSVAFSAAPRNALRADVWYRAVELAGLERGPPYSLRHSYALHCLQAGVPIATLAQQMGHADVTRTFQVDGSWVREMGADAASLREVWAAGTKAAPQPAQSP